LGLDAATDFRFGETGPTSCGQSKLSLDEAIGNRPLAARQQGEASEAGGLFMLFMSFWLYLRQYEGREDLQKGKKVKNTSFGLSSGSKYVQHHQAVLGLARLERLTITLKAPGH
jgi:hypothetical protein